MDEEVLLHHIQLGYDTITLKSISVIKKNTLILLVNLLVHVIVSTQVIMYMYRDVAICTLPNSTWLLTCIYMYLSHNCSGRLGSGGLQSLFI